MSPTRISLLLVDALNLIRRVYAAQPGDEGPEKAQGARDSSVQSLRRGLRSVSPSHAVCVFEGEGRSWRHDLLPSYKEDHGPMPPALAAALDSYKEAFLELGVRSLAVPHLEADDVIGTMAAKAVAAGAAARILSTDKIFLQLLPRGVRVRDHFRSRELEAAYVVERFGVSPERLVDLLALAGDRSNSIPGIPGVGPKRGADLLERFGTLEGVLERAEEVPGKMGESLREHAAGARLARDLLTLRTDLELAINLSELRYRRAVPEVPSPPGTPEPPPGP